MTPSKRIFDITLALLLAAVLAVPFVVLVLVLLVTQGRPVFYVAERMRAPGRSFHLWKLRTMTVAREDSGVSGGDKAARITPAGGFLRRTRLDEIPQLWNVLKGDMSFVGPRPALFNQDDLIALRTEAGVHELIPGLTGWAQINGRDELPIPQKVTLDVDYLQRRSLWFDCCIIGKTGLKVLRHDGVLH